jgi:hypothetical protein
MRLTAQQKARLLEIRAQLFAQMRLIIGQRRQIISSLEARMPPALLPPCFLSTG